MLRIGPVEMLILEDGSQTDNRYGAATSVFPAGINGPPMRLHVMFDETFLITVGTLRFTLGNSTRDARPGDYLIVPAGVPHTFVNVSDAPAEFFSTFTPAYYIDYFRELARLSAEGSLDPRSNVALMSRYATLPHSG